MLGFWMFQADLMGAEKIALLGLRGKLGVQGSDCWANV